MRRRSRRLLTATTILALAGIGAGLGYVLVTKYEGRNIHGSANVEFTPTQVVPPTLPPAPVTGATGATGASGPPKPKVDGIVWPTWGYDDRRLRTLAGTGQRPPYRVQWTFRAGSLLEFPPAIAYGRLFFSANHGAMVALNASTGKVAWRVETGRCVASSPAVDRNLVFQSFLNLPPCNSSRSDIDGEVVAFEAGSGKIRWRTTIGPTESSPLVTGGRVYVGDWRGNVYALDEQTGRILWTSLLDGKVKGAVALAGGRLYVGTYGGHVYALAAATGSVVWSASGQPQLGSAGTFYSTPAVAYDRVYIGSTDGRVYSIGAQSGELRWSYGTGGYVYGSPAVWRQLVLVGSYGGTFYAFDAATGAVRWSFPAGGPISGSATVIDGVVYFATLHEKTYALDAATGKKIWSWPDGKYTPAVADRHHLYLVGYARLYAMIRR